MTTALHADELEVVDHDDTVTLYRDVHYTLATAGLTTCTIIDATTGDALEQHHDILTTHARKDATDVPQIIPNGAQQ